LSATDISAKSSRRSGTSTSPSATRASVWSAPSAAPSNSITPRLGSRPMIALSSVVLPAPLGPMTVTMRPAPTVRLAPRSASTLP
jgi:hypothetical protein